MKTEIKIATYNIDGLPDYLDLNDLPWILKPIVWVYKLIKDTTIIKINDNSYSSENIKKIGKFLSESDSDIIGVQEDFNYHNELMVYLIEKYYCGTYSGGFDLKKLFKSAEWKTMFPLPRFKADGLNLIYNKSRIKVNKEEIISWNDGYGYFNHANDLLTHKGFRYYSLLIDDEYKLDIYVIHMDSDFYNETTCPNVSGDIEARKMELKQLTSFILNKADNGANTPSLIMGDTNSSNNYYWDVNNINYNLIYPINASAHLSIKEVIPNNFMGVDRIFYINNSHSNYGIQPIECYFDLDIEHLSDHKPLFAKFEIIKKS